jgi:DNA-binding NtrC family response regulator
LRERLDDLPALAEHFLTQPGKFGLKRRCTLSDSALQALQHYRWPGNVRELENVLTRAMVLCPGDTIEPEHLALTTTTPPSISQATNTDVVFFSYHQSMDAYGQRLIEEALRRNGWNQTKAAAELGLQRTYLTKLLRQKQISPKPPTTLSD